MRNRISSKTSKNIITTNTIVEIGMMAALTYIATAVIAIPVGNRAVLHLGDAVLFLCAILLGKKKGALAAAIGMTFFDLFSPYYIWAPFTFVIKGIMAYIVGSIAYRDNYEGTNVWNNLFAFIVAGLFMITGYFISGGALNHFVFGIPTMVQGLLAASADIPANILQVVGGVAIALPISKTLKGHLGRFM